ncbi:MAG: 6-phosphogluconolactonase, partial [Patescibacteria group bacterium]
ILLLLSGGSAFDILSYTTLPENASHMTLGVLDERFTKDPKENNFTTLKETGFFKNALQKGARTIDTSMRFERVEALAEAMNSAWSLWIEKNSGGTILATLGMGADGHTAGIMPYAEDPGMFDILFEDKQKFVIGYDAHGKHELTLPPKRKSGDGK